MTDESCRTGTESGVVCARGGIGCPMWHEGHPPRYRGDKHLPYIRVGNGGPWTTTERTDEDEG